MKENDKNLGFDPQILANIWKMGLGPDEDILQIGNYKIIRQLGEGGFGIVYLAEQESPIKRKVAFKVIKLGMDSKQIIARFEAERQTLALLEHPNIARIYDAGTTNDGRPYFVMEYIEGFPITEYCDHNKQTIEERLKLFIQVCEAIQYAHQKGVIHRDIKPSNIVVSYQEGKAVPKVIDFGIAKAINMPLTEKTIFTQQGQLLGTPEYMSPEQIDLKEGDIDTRADIYSLGVVLYELLSGILPFDPKTLRESGFAEMQRIIREEEPPLPSTKLSSIGEDAGKVAQSRQIQLSNLVKSLHKELEWIPLMAMRKERSCRYQSAADLAEDMQNYLNGNPLGAGLESKAYRIKKYIRRNRVLVTSVMLIITVLIVGIIASTYFAVKAEKERNLAEQNKEAAEKARNVAEQEKFKAVEAEKITQEKAELIRQQLYFMTINQVNTEYNRKNILNAQTLLENCPSDLRRWEWFHLWKKTGNSEVIYSGDISIVESVAFSPDGTKIAWAKGGITVWDIEKKIPVMHIDSNDLWMKPEEMSNAQRSFKSLAANSIVFSPDGRSIASGKGDGIIKIWEIENGKEILNIDSKQIAVSSVAFSPDGKWIASGGQNGTIKIWDVTNGSEIKTFSDGPNSIYCIAFSPNGTRIVSGEQFGRIKMWDSETGNIMSFSGHTYPTEIANSDYREYGVESIAFSPDGKYIVSEGTYGTVMVWNAINGTEVMTLSDFRTKNIISKKQTYETNSVGFSSDGRSIISGVSDGTIRIWNATSGEEMSVIYGHRGGVATVAFSPDGKQVVSGGTKDRKIKIQDIKKEPETISFRGHKDGIESIGFSHDGTRLISGGRDGAVKIWDSKNYSLLRDFAPRHVQIDLNTYKISEISSVVFSPDDTRIAIGDTDGMIRIIDTISNTGLLAVIGDKSGINSVAFSPDGKRIISGEGSISNSGTVRIYDIDNGNTFLSFSGSKSGVSSVAVSQNGKWLASSWNIIEVKLWNLETLTEIMTIEGHNSRVNCIVFNPEGTKIAVAHRDGIITVWDTKNVTERTLDGFQSNIKSLSFSPDGKRIISGGENGTIKIWDTQTGNEVLTFTGHEAEVSCVAFSPDGTMIISADMDGIINIWGTKSRTKEQTNQNQKEIFVNNNYQDSKNAKGSFSENKLSNINWDIQLMTASKMGKIEAVRDAISNGAHVDCRDTYGCTPLQWASDIGHIDIVKYLLEKGANINAIDNQSKTALMWAATSGHKEIAKLLLDKGANINAKDITWGSTALMWAADKGHPEVIKLLLEKGADINAKDISGKTALMWAASKKHFEIVKILQDKGTIE